MSKLARKFRIPAIFCAFAMLVCELIANPRTTMNLCDDGPYILMARTFAATGHIVYNGWASAMIVAQLWFAAAFIKLFGYSSTTVRMSTLLFAVITAFIFQRLLVRTGISERNATLGALALVLSPLYLMLAATFMSDIYGLFALIVCLYGCIRALRASGDRSAIAWIVFAVCTCALFGTSRQIAWLGDLAMVPSTLWLLRSRRRVLLAGAAATAASFVFILGCTHWFAHQPYAVIVPVLVKPFPTQIALRQLSYIVLEIPLLLLPLTAVFIPCVFRSRPRIRFLLLALLLAYLFIAIHSRNAFDPFLRFEPTAGRPNTGSWLTVSGVFTGLAKPYIVRTRTLIVLTVVCLAGLLGVAAAALQASDPKSSPLPIADELSWKELGLLFLPFSAGYLILLTAAAGTIHTLYDRYALGLLAPAIIVLLRLYQERVQPRLPLMSVLLIILMGACGIIVTRNTFALDRARVALADELHAAGIPYTAIDGGWDYNLDTELQNSNHINDPLIKNPAGAYVPLGPAPAGNCQALENYLTPHVHPVYGISFQPDACYGGAPFAPVQYRPWPFRAPVNLYAVRYAPPTPPRGRP